MKIYNYRHPLMFYVLSTLIPWAFWGLAGWLSHYETGSPWPAYSSGVLGIAGLFSPMIIAFIMMRREPALKGDLWNRIFSFRKGRPVYYAFALFLMPASILLAQLVSLLFGYSASQFCLAESTSFTYSLFPAWFLLFLAPLVEELAWHSYGTDCLRARFSLFSTCMIFAVYWALWHFPLSFIKDYYHSNLVETSWIYSLNFVVSLIPFVLIMNWLYYKTGRNIMVAIVFHITAGFFNELFATHPMSKVIQTGLLLLLCGFLLVKERKFFFDGGGHEAIE
jgi:membrane protease YdiL (CAAX protease family)